MVYKCIENDVQINNVVGNEKWSVD